MTESDLYEQVQQYMALKHPDIITHWDLSGMWTPSHKARNLYGRLNKRAWPDLYIARATFFPGTTTVCGGCFIELKAEGTRLKKRDGSWASPHIAEQAAMLEALSREGYVSQFGVGFDACIEIVESYLQPIPDVRPTNEGTHGYRGRDWSSSSDLWPEREAA